MSEKNLYKTLNRNMKGRWVVQRVENLVGPGTPDLYYTLRKHKSGWIELKHAHKWPKRSDTPLRLEHFTNDQKNFMRRHGPAGATIFVLLQVNRDYLLFNWDDAVKHLGSYNESSLKVLAIKYWKNRINYEEFYAELDKA